MASAQRTKHLTPDLPTPGFLTAAGLVVVCFVLVPLSTLLSRVPWGDMGTIASAPATRSLIELSLGAAVASTILSTIAGTTLAVWVSFLRRGAPLIRAIAYFPLALPPVVAGLALSSAFGNRGLLAPLLDAAGITFAFRFPGVVLAHLFITLPFVFVTVDSALRQLDQEIVTSARQVGMRSPAIIRRILLPATAPAIFSGAALAAARSLGEFGTTLTFAGSLPGRTRTLPLGIYLEREVNADRAYGLAFLLIVIAVLMLILAALPGLLRRHPAPAPADVAPLDGERLRFLCAPLGLDAGAEPVSPASPIEVRTQLAAATIPAGSRTVIVGPNGSGKSTLVSTAEAIVLTQRAALPGHATVCEVIDMITNDRARTTELLDAAGLRSLAAFRVTQLSGGQAALVALVRAMATRPTALVLDEPLAAVDVAAAAQWREFFRSLDHTVTLAWVTHSASELWEMATDVLVLESAHVAGQASLAEFAAAPPTSFAAELLELNAVRGLPSFPPDVISYWPWEAGHITTSDAADTDISSASARALGGSPQSDVITFPARVEALVHGRRATTYRLNYGGQQLCVVMGRASISRAPISPTPSNDTQPALDIGPGSSVRVFLPRVALSTPSH